MQRRVFLKALGWLSAAPVTAKALSKFDMSLPPVPKAGFLVMPRGCEIFRSTVPTRAVTGDMYFDDASHTMQVFNGTEWVALAPPTNASDCSTKAYVDEYVSGPIVARFCEYCESELGADSLRCPSCGAPATRRSERQGPTAHASVCA